ncbi:MAG: hypothetical protein LBH44_02790 [Treponema sp.]|nr:hypothetical protein [Treponema sp.]
MRKPEPLWCAFALGIILLIGACVIPVSLEEFLKDEKVQEIINGKTGEGGIVIDIDGEIIFGDTKPELELDDAGTITVLNEDDTVTLSINGSPQSVKITVTNAATAEYHYTAIVWYVNKNPLGTADGVSPEGDELIIDTASSPFNKPYMTQLFVVGTIGSGTSAKRYGTWIWIEVVN